jgi:hypothetical protein
MPARMKYSDLSPDLKARIDKAMDGAKVVKSHAGKMDYTTPPLSKPKRSKMTKTEAEYFARLMNWHGSDNVTFQGITLRMRNGHKYTPDFVVYDEGKIELHEVKGAYRLGSYQRARLAFDQARVEWPMFTFWWAEKKDGEWKISMVKE